MDEVAQVMHDLRLAAGSRGKLADALGVSDSTAQGWERFGRLPEAVNLARIIRAFPEHGRQLVEAIAPGFEERGWDGAERRATGPAGAPPDGGVPQTGSRLGRGLFAPDQSPAEDGEARREDAG